MSYTLTHTDFPFAAALIIDNLDAGYFQAGLMGWDPANTVELNGTAPFGAGLSAWLERAPGFNVERIRAPLQMQLTSALSHAMAGWELFSRLGKPVEYYAIPHVDRGSHGVQNPTQCLASQQ